MYSCKMLTRAGSNITHSEVSAKLDIVVLEDRLTGSTDTET